MSCATFRGWVILLTSIISCWTSPPPSRAAYPYFGIDPATGLATGTYVSPTDAFNFNPALNNQGCHIGHPKFCISLQNSFTYEGLVVVYKGVDTV